MINLIRRTAAIAVVIAAAIIATGSASDARPECQYPSVRVWLTGGAINVEQGPFYSYACPTGKPHHHLIMTRGRNGQSLLVKMAPGH